MFGLYELAQNEVPKSPKAFHGWASAEKSNADSNQVTVGPYIILRSMSDRSRRLSAMALICPLYLLLTRQTPLIVQTQYQHYNARYT